MRRSLIIMAAMLPLITSEAVALVSGALPAPPPPSPAHPLQIAAVIERPAAVGVPRGPQRRAVRASKHGAGGAVPASRSKRARARLADRCQVMTFRLSRFEHAMRLDGRISRDERRIALAMSTDRIAACSGGRRLIARAATAH